MVAHCPPEPAASSSVPRKRLAESGGGNNEQARNREADLNGLLEQHACENQQLRKRAAEEIASWRKADSAGLSRALLARAALDEADDELRVVAAVLLRNLLEAARRSPGESPASESATVSGLVQAMPHALSVVAEVPRVRKHLTSATALLALQHAKGSSGEWPELHDLLASWCRSGDCHLHAAVLSLLEELSDEIEEDIDDAPVSNDSGDMDVDADASSSGPQTVFFALLCNLQTRGGALATVLREALALATLLREGLAMQQEDPSLQALPSIHGKEEEDKDCEVARDAAARIYVWCMSKHSPEQLRDMTWELVPFLADAAAEGVSEACLNAVALSAAANPKVWSTLPDEVLASLPTRLALAATNSNTSMEVRRAALAAAIELASAIAEPCGVSDATLNAASCAAEAVVSILLDGMDDEDTDTWAESDEAGDLIGACSGASQGALEDAIAGCGRLLIIGTGERKLRELAAELGESQWKPRHASMLLQAQFVLAVATSVACRGETELSTANSTAQSAGQAATGLLGHEHPRVRWAALQVWSNLMATDLDVLPGLFAEAFPHLCQVAARDAYMRVRRSALVVLLAAVQASAQQAFLTEERAAYLLRVVLAHQMTVADTPVRQTCKAMVATLQMCFCDDCNEDAMGIEPVKNSAASIRMMCDEILSQSLAAFERDGEQVVIAEDRDIVWPAGWH